MRGFFERDKDEIENEVGISDKCFASITDIITIDEERKMQQESLLATAQLFCLNIGCS